MKVGAVAGWALVTAGPFLALGAYWLLAVHHRRTTRIGIAGAAFVGLVWFVGTADWLPPAWAKFWRAHSISASVTTTVLVVAAGWLFVDERRIHRRLTALLRAEQDWVRHQIAWTQRMLEVQPPARVPVRGHAAMAADLATQLMLQQQWIASMFTVSALRSEDHNADFMVNLSELSHMGAAAAGKVAQLRGLLASLDPDSLLDEEVLHALWDDSLAALQACQGALERWAGPLMQAHWEAQAKTGLHPTHPIADAAAMTVKSAKSWPGDAPATTGAGGPW